MSGEMSAKERFQRIKPVGAGSFGTVWQCKDKKTDKIVAVKCIPLEDEDNLDDLRMEVGTLAACNHPNIIKYYEAYVHGKEVWLVMEYLGGGSGSSLMAPAGPLSEVVIALIMKQLVSGLKYLHENQVIHRDIKAANVMFSDNGEAKLVDFGVSRRLTECEKAMTFTGTPYWMAPEVIVQSGYNESADIWSLGITAVEFAEGNAPYFNTHPMRALMLIPKNEPYRLDSSRFSKDFCDFVATCLQKDHTKRPTAAQLIKHPFINGKSVKKIAPLVQQIQSYQRFSDLMGSVGTEDFNPSDISASLEASNQGLEGSGWLDVSSSGPSDLSQTTSAVEEERAVGGWHSAIPDAEVPTGVPLQPSAQQTLPVTLINVVYPALAAMLQNAGDDEAGMAEKKAIASIKMAFDQAEATSTEVSNRFLQNVVQILTAMSGEDEQQL